MSATRPIAIGCRFEFDSVAATHAVVMVEPHPTELERVISPRFTVEPAVETSQYYDQFDNACRRFTLPAGVMHFGYSATYEASVDPDPIETGAVALAPSELPDEALQFLLPSRYCESDKLVGVSLDEFGTIPSGWQQVQAICDWVHAQVRFDYLLASPTHTAFSVLEARVGVCRDFTHLAIALCRAMNVPARYVFGYLPDIDVPDPGVPMDFCAWMEVYLGGAWHTFDPRNNQRRIGRCVIARGRDAADVAMVTSFGQPRLVEMTVVAEPAVAP